MTAGLDEVVVASSAPISNRRWLKAGVVSLLLANIALDGMESICFGAERPDGRQIAPKRRRGQNWGISLIRYADDFVVTAPSREVLEAHVLPRLNQFLAGRGLELSQAKTRIVHIDDGFDFLGFNLRHFPNGKLLVRPQKEKVALQRRRRSAFFRRNRQMPTAEVIKQLPPVIRGLAAGARSQSLPSRPPAATAGGLVRPAKRSSILTSSTAAIPTSRCAATPPPEIRPAF